MVSTSGVGYLQKWCAVKQQARKSHFAMQVNYEWGKEAAPTGPGKVHKPYLQFINRVDEFDFQLILDPWTSLLAPKQD